MASRKVGHVKEFHEISFDHLFANDVVYEHVEEIDWLTYLGTVGGLAGMWPGLSLVDFSFRIFAIAHLANRVLKSRKRVFKRRRTLNK